MAGATLGGGSGYLSRTHGLTLDNLLSVDLVTADGRARRVSGADHTDLFWAIRGAGANFGIATSLRLQLHRIGPQVTGRTDHLSLRQCRFQQAFDANLPKGQRYFSRAHDLNALSDAAIDVATTHVQRMQGLFTAAYFDPGGGAIGRVDPSATPFAGRTAVYGFHVLGGWMDVADDETVMRWARTFHDAMAPMASGGVYVNVLGDDQDNRVPAAYGDNYSRRVELKTLQHRTLIVFAVRELAFREIAGRGVKPALCAKVNSACPRR